MTFNIFSNGTVADATQVDDNFNFNTKRSIINTINLQALGISTRYTRLPIVSHNMVSESTVDKVGSQVNGSVYGHLGSSTAFISRRGFIAFGSLVDNFNDGTISSAVWTVGSNNATITFAEANSSIVMDNGGLVNAANSGIYSSGFNFHGSNTEIFVDYELHTFGASGGASGNVGFAISNGAGAQVLIDGLTGGPANDNQVSDRVLLMRYDNAVGSLYVDSLYYGSRTLSGNGSVVYYNPTTLGSFNLNPLGTTKNLCFYGSNPANGAGDFGGYDVHIYGASFIRTGMTGSSSFVSNAYTLDSNGSTVLIYTDWLPAMSTGSGLTLRPTGSIFATAVMNNTGTFGTNNAYGSWKAQSTSGSTSKVKITATHPSTIVIGSYQTPILVGWGMTYN